MPKAYTSKVQAGPRGVLAKQVILFYFLCTFFLFFLSYFIVQLQTRILDLPSSIVTVRSQCVAVQGPETGELFWNVSFFWLLRLLPSFVLI